MRRLSGSSDTAMRLTFLSLIVFLTGLPGMLCAGEPPEYQVKSAMVFNMLKFMDWPAEGAQQLQLCVVGRGPFVAGIATLHGKVVKGRSVVVQQVSPASVGGQGCDVLVFGDVERSTLAQLLEQSRTAPVVTLADTPGFIRSGGVVGFVLQAGKVRFEINQAAALRHRIRISSQLLKLATSVIE